MEIGKIYKISNVLTIFENEQNPLTEKNNPISKGPSDKKSYYRIILLLNVKKEPCDKNNNTLLIFQTLFKQKIGYIFLKKTKYSYKNDKNLFEKWFKEL